MGSVAQEMKSLEDTLAALEEDARSLAELQRGLGLAPKKKKGTPPAKIAGFLPFVYF